MITARENREFCRTRRAQRLPRTVDRTWGLPAAGWAAAAALALYSVTLGFGFLFDDRSLIGPDGPLPLGNGTLPYRPLRYASYAIDHWVGGGAPWAYHASNVVLHALVAGLTASISRRLGAGEGAAALAGVAVAVHPLGAEATAYVAGRRDLLVTAMGLVAVASWLSERGRTVLAVLCVLLSVAAKESGVAYLGILTLASIAGLGPELRVSAGALISAGVAALALPVAYGAIGPVLPVRSVCAIAAAGTTMATHYAVNVIAPLRLSVEYPALAHVSDDCATLVSVSSVAGFALIGAATGAVFSVFSRRGQTESQGPRCFAWAWTGLIFVLIATVIGMHEPGVDRHAYPLVAALSIALAVSVHPLHCKHELARRCVSAVALAYLATLTVLTASRLPSWRDERSLWTAAVASAPDSGRARHNLAGVLLAAGEFDAEAAQLRVARELKYPPAMLGSAAAACARGRIHRGHMFIKRARALGIAAADAEPISRFCEARQASARKGT